MLDVETGVGPSYLLDYSGLKFLGDVAQFLQFSFHAARRKALGARENCLLSYPTFSFNQRRGLGFQALKRGT